MTLRLIKEVGQHAKVGGKMRTMGSTFIPFLFEILRDLTIVNCSLEASIEDNKLGKSPSSSPLCN